MEGRVRVRQQGWWEKRTKMEKCLIVFCSIVTLLAILILILLILKSIEKQNASKDDICLTPTCVQEASNILDKIDTSKNPCDDFYAFACGNFLKNTFIPESQTSVDSFSIIQDKIDQQIRQVLEEPVQPSELEPFQQIKSLYQACMDRDSIEKNSLKLLKEHLKRLGGWPVLEGDNWYENGFDWKWTTYTLKHLGFKTQPLIAYSITLDSKNSSRRSLTMEQPYIFFMKQKAKGRNVPIVQEMNKYMVDVATLLGAEPHIAQRDMTDALDFEISLARILLPDEERRDPNAEYNPMTVGQMETEFPFIPWLEYINTLLQPKAKITRDDIVIVALPKYFRSLGNLLSRTRKRILSNYMLWTAVAGSLSYLNEEMRSRQLEFRKIYSGVTKRQPRWKECTTIAKKMHIAASALYVRKYFDADDKKDMIDMTDNIKSQFIETLHNIDWMDETTKQHALAKAETIEKKIGFPNELLDDEEIQSYYRSSKLVIKPDSYFESILNLNAFIRNTEAATLMEPVNKYDWKDYADSALVNAYYDTNENVIIFPAGVLQNVFFNKDRPSYMNYGGIGFIVGHEISHGFDDEGRQYDKDGNLRDWWSEETSQAFKRKAQCIIDQYSKCTVSSVNMTINGNLTQGENIADNAGIKQSYLAYKKWSEINGPEPSLPGLNYTSEQMFWISSATSWCSKQRVEELKQDLLVSPHPPDEFRVNVPLINSRYFAKDFECELGTKMNPSQVCTVW